MVTWRRKRHLETVEVLEFFVGSCAGGGGKINWDQVLTSVLSKLSRSRSTAWEEPIQPV